MKSNKQNRAYRKALVVLHRSLLLVALVIPGLFLLLSVIFLKLEYEAVFLSCYLFVLGTYAADFFEFREVYDEYLKEISEEEKE